MSKIAIHSHIKYNNHMLLNIFSYGLDYQPLFKQLYCNYLNNNTKTDSLILLQDGVYLGLTITNNNTSLLNIYALDLDVTARGLVTAYQDIKSIKLVSYEEFVDLVLQHDKNITW